MYDSPDPDKMYVISDAAPFTSSPAREVFEHNTSVIRRRLTTRQAKAVARLNAHEKARQEVSGTPVHATNVYYTPNATTANQEESNVSSLIGSTTCPIEPIPAFEMRPNASPQQNTTLHRADFARRVTRQPGSELLDDPPPCVQRSCPYCRGPLLLQRFSLLQRLHQLNVLLYGHIDALHYLEKS